MLIKVKCYPKSKKELLNKKDENSFEIFLKEKPERGGANKRIFEILAEYFSISKKRIKLIKGAKTQNKIFEIYDK
ncbi:MAG: DUF167 domain-containing protein [Minisyncoccales bacterium]|jgi:uncharacterized protein YggU (UPF0235/DUF167 family)